MPVSEQTARVMAKTWRAGNELERCVVEMTITRANAWDQFRYDNDFMLVARISEETRTRRIGSDCHAHSTGHGLVH